MSPSSDAARRIALVIWAALLGGCVAFLAVGAFLRAGGQLGGAPAPEILPWTALALGVVLVALSFVVPRLVGGRSGASPEDVARTRFIVGWALRESATLLGTLAWAVSGDAKGLAAAAIGLASLAATMPSAERWSDAVHLARGDSGGASSGSGGRG